MVTDGRTDRQRCEDVSKKVVYKTAPVAVGWAGAVMIWAGACSNTNFSTLKMPKNAKKAKWDGRTDGRTDGPTR